MADRETTLKETIFTLRAKLLKAQEELEALHRKFHAYESNAVERTERLGTQLQEAQEELTRKQAAYDSVFDRGVVLKQELDKAIERATRQNGLAWEMAYQANGWRQRAETAERIAARRSQRMWQLTVDLIVANDAWRREDRRAERAEALARHVVSDWRRYQWVGGDYIEENVCPRCGGHWDIQRICCAEADCPLYCVPAEALEQRKSIRDGMCEYSTGDPLNQASLRLERAEARLSQHECICGGPSAQTCGPKCKYPNADGQEAPPQRGGNDG